MKYESNFFPLPSPFVLYDPVHDESIMTNRWDQPHMHPCERKHTTPAASILNGTSIRHQNRAEQRMYYIWVFLYKYKGGRFAQLGGQLNIPSLLNGQPSHALISYRNCGACGEWCYLIVIIAIPITVKLLNASTSSLVENNVHDHVAISCNLMVYNYT